MGRAKAGALAIVLVTTACSQGPKLDLGSNDGGGSAPPVEAGAPSIAGTWSGYAELYTFPDGSDVITMTIAQAADGSYSGTIVFGTQPAPPPPSDPAKGYPPFLYGLIDAAPSPSYSAPGSSGFPYTLQNVVFDGQRLQFSYDENEIWKAWCALEQPIYWAGDPDAGPFPGVPPAAYFCAPVIDGYNFMAPPTIVPLPDGGETPFDLIRFSLCGVLPQAYRPLDSPFVCRCTATSCATLVGLDSADLQLSGERLDGSSVFGTTHFTRH